MRAVAASFERRAVELVDHPEPRLERDTDVLVRILEVGICGTDREIARFAYGAAPRGAPYLVLGHEALGRVVATGDAVLRTAPGDLVVLRVRRPCTRPWCRACRSGRPDFCFSGEYTERGIQGRHGYMAERVVDDQDAVHVVPGALREIGVLVEPLTIAEKALIQLEDIQERLPWRQAGTAGAEAGQAALVLGAGPVGLLGVLALRARGFATWLYSREPDDGPKAAWAASVGARYVSASAATVSALLAQMGRADLVYEATGASRLAFEMLEALDRNGVFVFTGVPGRRQAIVFNASRVMRRLVFENQLVFGTVNAGPDAFEAAIADLAAFRRRWPRQVAALITARHRPERAPGVLGAPAAGMKQVVAFDEE